MLMLKVIRNPFPMQVPKQKTKPLNLCRNASLSVGNLNTELLRACNNIDPLSRRNGVGNPTLLSVLASTRGTKYILSGEGLAVHQQKLNIANVVDEESLVAGGHHVAGLLV